MSIRRRVRSITASRPTLFIGAYRFFRSAELAHELLIHSDTELVIEGFPRSGNTFAVTAFRQAQGRPVKIAHHLHAPAQILAGVKRRLPVVVLVRRPEEAVRSLVVRDPSYSVSDALRDYVSFYRAVMPVRDRVVVADFRQVISRYGDVIAAVNRKYGTHYKRFGHAAQAVRAVFAEIDSYSDAAGGAREAQVARPSAVRRHLYRAIDVARDADERLLDRSRICYERLVGP